MMEDVRQDILVVDDDAAIAELVADTLRHAGMGALVRFDGESGWEAFRDGSFDLVVLDIMMPGLDGFELCAHPARVPRPGDLPFGQG